MIPHSVRMFELSQSEEMNGSIVNLGIEYIFGCEFTCWTGSSEDA